MSHMIQEECIGFFQQVKSHFDYLFDEYEFSVTHKGGDGVHCLIVLQSGGCRIEFLYDRGIVEISVGTSQHLYNILWAINFVKGAPPPTREELAHLAEFFWSMRMDQGLATFSKMLKPVCGEVVRLFQENDFAKRRAEFERFYHS